MSPTEPTLLIFTLGPGGEGARRRLLPGRWGALQGGLLRKSLDSAIAAGRACGCRIEVSSPERLDLDPDIFQMRQRGRCFASRLRHAVEDARSRTTGPLLIVGSDVPGLSARHLAEALGRLRRRPDQVVLGPSPDGGFYLLATGGTLDEALAEVRWCRRDTLATLLRALRRRGREVALLAPLRDLDRSADLQRWLAREASALPGWEDLVRLLRILLAALGRPLVQASLGHPRAACVLARPGRGPPG